MAALAEVVSAAEMADAAAECAADGNVIMVTGGTGLVGKAIEEFVSTDLASASERWVFLSSRDADLRDKVSTEALFARVRPTHCIHLAALVGGLFSNMAKKVEFYREVRAHAALGGGSRARCVGGAGGESSERNRATEGESSLFLSRSAATNETDASDRRTTAPKSEPASLLRALLTTTARRVASRRRCVGSRNVSSRAAARVFEVERIAARVFEVGEEVVTLSHRRRERADQRQRDGGLSPAQLPARVVPLDMHFPRQDHIPDRRGPSCAACEFVNAQHSARGGLTASGSGRPEKKRSLTTSTRTHLFSSLGRSLLRLGSSPAIG